MRTILKATPLCAVLKLKHVITTDSSCDDFQIALPSCYQSNTRHFNLFRLSFFTLAYSKFTMLGLTLNPL